MKNVLDEPFLRISDADPEKSGLSGLTRHFTLDRTSDKVVNS